MANGKCRMHGGKSIGSPGHQNAKTHGIYSSSLTDDERSQWDDIQLGSVDDELRLCRTRLVRALKTENASGAKPELDEVTLKKGKDGEAGSQKVYRQRDYVGIVDRLMSRIESLEKTRSALIATNGGGDDDIDGFEVVAYD